MTREDIVEKVNALLAEEFEVDAEEFVPDANVRDTLSLDSLSLVDLVAIIQQTYKVKFPWRTCGKSRRSTTFTITSNRTRSRNDKL